jgi:predicted dithiol-disulfide oxidoreductase (DUF899 family)
MTTTMAHPRILLQDEWLAERKELVAHEKDLTKHYDRVNAERRRLPMVEVEKDYSFEGPSGQRNLKDLFEAVRSSSSITSCSTRRGTRDARGARAL